MKPKPNPDEPRVTLGDIFSTVERFLTPAEIRTMLLEVLSERQVIRAEQLAELEAIPLVKAAMTIRFLDDDELHDIDECVAGGVPSISHFAAAKKLKIATQRLMRRHLNPTGKVEASLWPSLRAVACEQALPIDILVEILQPKLEEKRKELKS